MVKRQPLTFDNIELARDLKESAGKGVDAFFSPPPDKLPEEVVKRPPEARQMPSAPLESKKDTSMPPRAKVEEKSEPPKDQTSTIASTQASVIASYNADTIDAVRKVVKELGSKVSFVRLTPEEKSQLLDIVYTYKRQNVKTTENEINRIAINYLIQDYQENGENSLLAKVISALHA